MMWKIVFLVLSAVFAVGLGSLVGGFQNINVDDARALEALDFAVVEHNSRSNDMYVSEVAKVVNVQRQIVRGIKYIINVEMMKTCRKGSPNEACPIHQDGAKAQIYECTFTVVSVPWMSEFTLENETCPRGNNGGATVF